MSRLRLVIGNKNYSSWSLRPWLLMRHAEIPFDEQQISFTAHDFGAQVRRYSPAGKVPVLIDRELVVWDSLAIVEYLAETFPERQLWPADRQARALARSLCAEMHSGFQAMRGAMTMNLEARFTTPLFPVAVGRDVSRVLEIWDDCRNRFGDGGPFLFGRFSVADAFFAPVTRRFLTYDVPLPQGAATYVATIDALPAMQAWLAAALQENDFYAEDEPYRLQR